MKSNKLCVVFVCDEPYFENFIKTCTMLIENGKYDGNICLVVGDDLNNKLSQHSFIIKHDIIVKYFPNITFPREFLEVNNYVRTDGRNITKKFQWHKMHLFNSYFKQWNYIFYIDCGMHILSDITPILNDVEPNTLLAHSDAYPIYELKLRDQFDKNIIKYFDKLNNLYHLNINYFQTGILLYDTALIESDTYDNLRKLMLEYPISKTNEQAIIALYFTNIKPAFEQIRIHNENTHFYDFASRNANNKYIMVKNIF